MTFSADIINLINNLPPDTVETIYRYKVREYRIEDAKAQCDDFIRKNKLDCKAEFTGFTDNDYACLADEFLRHHDCNIAENDMWDSVIDYYVESHYPNIL